MTKHKPVLLQEIIEAINPKPGGVYVDATLGGGGHFLEILNSLEGEGSLIAFDVNQKAIKEFKKLLQDMGFIKQGEKYLKEGLSVYLVNENFRKFDEGLERVGINEVDGIIADLGLSTDQIDELAGISYVNNSDLDMRMDESLGVKASDLLNGLYYKELVQMFERYGDISFAKRLSKEIVEQRKREPFKTTMQLKHLIQKIVPYSMRKGAGKNPEAKVFQALRIAVNDELNTLRIFLPLAFEALRPDGRLAVISFHSGEDKIVKGFSKELKKQKLAELSVVIKPTNREQKVNKRSSSAKLRIITKLK